MSSTLNVPAAASIEAIAHFEARLSYETDCWDVHTSLRQGKHDFVLLDVRTRALFVKSHIPGAVNLPYGKITRRRMDEWPVETLFVVYCAGPHCNGANKAALALARLGRPVKEMIGGITGWKDEGFTFSNDVNGT